MPLCPIDIPPQATTAHECQGVPFGAVVTPKRTTGTKKLTSPTSVEPPIGCSAVSFNGLMEPSIPMVGLKVAS